MLVMRLPAQHGFGYCTPGPVAEHVLAGCPIPSEPAATHSCRNAGLAITREFWCLSMARYSRRRHYLWPPSWQPRSADITLLQVVALAGSLAPPVATVWDVSALDSLQLETCNYLRKVAGRLALKIDVAPPCMTVRLGHPASAIGEAVQDIQSKHMSLRDHVAIIKCVANLKKLVK
jgi:hypothetical protein